MTGGGAGVTAVRAGQRAGLQAAAVPQAVPPVADPPAAMRLTGQRFVTNQTARDVLKVARDVAAFLVLSHAPLLGEEGAGGALLLTVAVMEHWVVALVSSGAHVFALGGFGAAGDGGVQDSEATVARQLVETGLPAGAAVATVTGLLAAVEPAVELVATDLEALVFQNHAAQLATLVAAAGAFLAAALLTSEHQLVFGLDRLARDLLGLGATSASDGRGQGAGTAGALVAHLLTQMDRVAGTTGQGSVACLPTGGDGISTVFSLGVAQLQEFS